MDAKEPKWLRYGPDDIEFLCCSRCDEKYLVKTLKEIDGDYYCPNCRSIFDNEVKHKTGKVELIVRVTKKYEVWDGDECIFRNGNWSDAKQAYRDAGGKL